MQDHLQRIQAGEHPADGAVATNDQQPEPRHICEQLQCTLWLLPWQLNHLHMSQIA